MLAQSDLFKRRELYLNKNMKAKRNSCQFGWFQAPDIDMPRCGKSVLLDLVQGQLRTRPRTHRLGHHRLEEQPRLSQRR